MCPDGLDAQMQGRAMLHSLRATKAPIRVPLAIISSHIWTRDLERNFIKLHRSQTNHQQALFFLLLAPFLPPSLSLSLSVETQNPFILEEASLTEAACRLPEKRLLRISFRMRK